MTFNDYKAYRQAMYPILKQRKLLNGNPPEPIDNPPASPLIALYDVNEEMIHRLLRVLYYGAIIACILLMLRGCESPSWAYSDEDAVKTIVGEAANQGMVGMVAVAEVIRHKSSLRGFYGLHASHSAHEPKWVWNMARKAWYASATTNYTHGADHFENIHAFGCPYWVKNCVLTFEYRDHRFYKEII